MSDLLLCFVELVEEDDTSLLIVTGQKVVELIALLSTLITKSVAKEIWNGMNLRDIDVEKRCAKQKPELRCKFCLSVS